MDKQQQQGRHCWKDELLHIDHSFQFVVEMAKVVCTCSLRDEEGHLALMCLDAEGKRDGFILRKGEIWGGVENAGEVRRPQVEGCNLRWRENFDDVIAASALLGMGGKPAEQLRICHYYYFYFYYWGGSSSRGIYHQT